MDNRGSDLASGTPATRYSRPSSRAWNAAGLQRAAAHRSVRGSKDADLRAAMDTLARRRTDAGNSRSDSGAGPRDLRRRADAAADSTARTGLPDLSAEAARGDCVRRLGRGRQRRRDQAHHRKARSARLCGLSDQRPARRGQDAPLSVSLLAAPAGARTDRHFDRSWYGRVLVERVEGFAKAASGSAASRKSILSSGNCGITE